ncbi:MAG: PilN domain-containing protein, partial [Nanoarchaeota archaeon]|nr:PilN domain-containing protein [Nanoarchaeota archaeon]
NSINENLLKSNDFYKNQPNRTNLLTGVAKALPENTYLTMFSLSPKTKEGDRLQVSLSGYAIDRETLFEFKKNLEAEPNFKEVYFPPASWVTPTDFSATFEIKL